MFLCAPSNASFRAGFKKNKKNHRTLLFSWQGAEIAQAITVMYFVLDSGRAKPSKSDDASRKNEAPRRRRQLRWPLSLNGFRQRQLTTSASPRFRLTSLKQSLPLVPMMDVTAVVTRPRWHGMLAVLQKSQRLSL
jgi:hypothetical protein